MTANSNWKTKLCYLVSPMDATCINHSIMYFATGL